MIAQVDFVSAFVASISMILVSEFGDKTFFIAAIMAMRQNRSTVFSAAMSALILMTVLSAAMGFTLPNILPPKFTRLAATVLFLFFGCKLLYDAYFMDNSVDSKKEELKEVEEELEEIDANETAQLLETGNKGGKSTANTAQQQQSTSKDATAANSSNSTASAPASANDAKSAAVTAFRRVSKQSWLIARRFFSPVFIQCFTLTFLAEWGDRSQIATIALAAAKDPFGVTLGGILGHACCTGVAVVGGKLLATKISERTISIVGGLLFLAFTAHSLIYAENELV